MSQAWQNNSEIVCGYVLKDKLSADAVNPLDVYPPYQHIITMKRNGDELPDIVAKDFNAVDACLHAVERVNGTLKNPLDYLRILQKSANNARASVDLESVQKRLNRGDDVKSSEIMAVANKMDTGYTRWIPLSEVKPQKAKFVKTGYDPIDDNVGGLPYACVTILGGTPGLGKTSLALKIINNMIMLSGNEKKKAAVLSLEMTIGQIHQRLNELSDLKDKDKARILTNRVFNIHEICAAVTQLAAVENLCVVMIDFADLIVEGEQSEAAMGVIYRSLELLATKIEIPILLICQLNRETYKGGLPRIYHIRYSGLAEATARLILLVYNPMGVLIGFDKDDKQPLPIQDGRAYILVGKSNFGYKKDGPGAISVDFDGETGWGDKTHGQYIRLSI